jgi:S1-C subfamily serine protease
VTNQQNPARYRATMMRYRFGIWVILGLLAMHFGGAAAAEENGPWIATARLIRSGAPSGSGVYLGSGLIVTAAHLVDPNSPMSATVARVTLPATILKHGSEIDLSLLKIDKDKLPANPPLPDMPLCQAPPWPGDPVIVADATAITKSRIASPQGLNFLRFSTLIGDVATTGNSGSGVFDPVRKCLLGIISVKLTVTSEAGPKDVAKYFVPAEEVRSFVSSAVNSADFDR